MEMQCYYDMLGNFVECGYIGFLPDWLLLILGVAAGICLGILIQIFRDYKLTFNVKRK